MMRQPFLESSDSWRAEWQRWRAWLQLHDVERRAIEDKQARAELDRRLRAEFEAAERVQAELERRSS